MNWKTLLTSTKIPVKYHEASLDNLSIDNDPKGRSFKDMGNRWISNPRSLILLGKPGRGKTFYMYALMKAYVDTYGLLPVEFYRAIEIDNKILEYMKEYGSASGFIHDLTSIDVLFIDDLGMERSTDRVSRDFYDIIDRRFSDEKITIISTNLSMKELREFYGERISSRLQQSILIEFPGVDLRNPANKKLVEAI